MPSLNTPPNTGSKIKYRSSCDRCQDNKVKCGQQKPECERCVKKRLVCVYSPIRTMGRPRKAQSSSGTSTTADSHHVAASLAPAANVDVMQGIEEDQPRHLNPQDPETENIDPELDQGPINLDTTPMSYPSSSTNGTRTTSRGSTNGDASSATGIATPSTTSGPSPLPSCYTSILSRSLKLEQILLSAAGDPIGLEAALEAESDFRALKTQLFSCPGGGHHHPDSPPKHVTAITGTSFILTTSNAASVNKPPCLSSFIESRLCLTTLIMYAERVAEVLKDAIADFQPFPGVDSCSTRCSYFGVQNYRVLRVMDFHALRVDGFFLDQGSERVNKLWDLGSVREQLAVASRGGGKGDFGARTEVEIVTAPERKQLDGDDDAAAERELERQQGNGYENRNFGSLTPAEGRALRRIFRLRMQKFKRALVDIHRFVKPPSPPSAADGQGPGKEDHDRMMVAMALAFVEPMVDNLVRRVEVMEQVMAGTLG